MILTPDEVATLTDRTRKDAQVRVLRFMGIEHKIRPDGSIAVSREHIERVLGGATTVSTTSHEPDWGAIQCQNKDSQRTKVYRPAGNTTTARTTSGSHQGSKARGTVNGGSD